MLSESLYSNLPDSHIFFTFQDGLVSIKTELQSIYLLLNRDPGSPSNTRAYSVLTSLSWGVNLSLPVFGWCVIECKVSGICPERCAASSLLRKSKRVGPIENPPTPALCMVWAQKRIGILTGTTPSRTSPALGWSVIAIKAISEGGGCQGCAVAGFWWKCTQNVCHNLIFWHPVWSSKRLGNVSGGIGTFLNMVHRNFVSWNLKPEM